jgi:hypothetical protein
MPFVNDRHPQHNCHDIQISHFGVAMSTDELSEQKPSGLRKPSKLYPAKPIDAKPIDAESVNGHLSSQKTLSWGPDDPSGKNTIEFKFWDHDKPLANSKDSADNRSALESVYKDLTNKDPEDASDDQLNRAILSYFQEKYGKNVKIIIVRLRIDPKEPSKSYLAGMEKLDNFLPGSRQRFLNRAIAHLGTLDPKDSNQTDGRLHKALVNARGYMNDDQRAELAKLSQGKPGLEGENNSLGQNRTTSQLAQPGGSQHSQEPQQAKVGVQNNTVQTKESRARADLVKARSLEPNGLER